MTKPIRVAERGTIVNAGAIDWLSLTTFDTRLYTALLDIIRDTVDITKREPFQSRGYSGDRAEDISWGIGRQKGQQHYMINVTGKSADTLADKIVSNADIDISDATITRLDLQMTVPSTRTMRLDDVRYMAQSGALGEFAGRGKPRVYGYGGHDGDTIYIGSHKSQKMLRIYDKPVIIKGKRETYERTEIQLRSTKAQQAWNKIAKHRGPLNRTLLRSMIKGHYKYIPEAMQDALSLKQHLEGYIAQVVKPEYTESEPDKQLKWLLSLKRTLISMTSKQDEAGNQSKELLLEVLAVATSHNKLLSWRDVRLVDSNGEILYPPLTDSDKDATL